MRAETLLHQVKVQLDGQKPHWKGCECDPHRHPPFVVALETMLAASRSAAVATGDDEDEPRRERRRRHISSCVRRLTLTLHSLPSSFFWVGKRLLSNQEVGSSIPSAVVPSFKGPLGRQ